jgi:hypothetical protein
VVYSRCLKWRSPTHWRSCRGTQFVEVVSLFHQCCFEIAVLAARPPHGRASSILSLQDHFVLSCCRRFESATTITDRRQLGSPAYRMFGSPEPIPDEALQAAVHFPRGAGVVKSRGEARMKSDAWRTRAPERSEQMASRGSEVGAVWARWRAMRRRSRSFVLPSFSILDLSKSERRESELRFVIVRWLCHYQWRRHPSPQQAPGRLRRSRR